MSIRVMVVDDSAFMRKLIAEILNEQQDIEVVATARNGQDALDKLATTDVDVITLDIEMPVLNGLDALKIIMSTNPKPVLLLSSVTKKGSDITMKALSLGAIDFIAKPSGAISLDLKGISQEIIDKVRSTAGAKVLRQTTPKAKVKGVLPTERPAVLDRDASRTLVIIGSSTGGPKAVEEVFQTIPRNLSAGIIVVQHMPKGFTRSFADRLNTMFPFHVKEAEDNDLVRNGQALIAPGDHHLVLNKNKRVSLNQDPPVQFLRPNIDVTMLSIPQDFRGRIVGVILTGMGRDGTRGMGFIKQLAGHTIAQDKATSTIYSMPKVVFEEGYADYVLPIDKIGESIVKLVKTIG